MKVLVAPDKFKGSLTSEQVIAAITQGVEAVFSDVEILTQPLADGGEGSLDLIATHLNLQAVEVEAYDPLMRPLRAPFFTDGRRAFIEMAKVSGLLLLSEEERNPLKTSTYGTGQLINAALAHGCSEINLLVGGSATNDCGLGMAIALGYQVTGAEQGELLGLGEDLLKFERITSPSKSPIGQAHFNVLTDVKNPLLGEYGAAFVYAKQKGASRNEIKELEAGAQRLVDYFSNGFESESGAGAAGGLGYGAMAFLGARVISGIDYIMELTGIDAMVKQVDLVISGEGSFDEQSIQGKVVSGLKALCERHEKPLAIVCGRSDVNEWQGTAIYAILDRAESTSDAMDNASDYLTGLSADLIRDFRAKR